MHVKQLIYYYSASYMKVPKVNPLQQSQSLGESHPVPAQAFPAYTVVLKSVLFERIKIASLIVCAIKCLLSNGIHFYLLFDPVSIHIP